MDQPGCLWVCWMPSGSASSGLSSVSQARSLCLSCSFVSELVAVSREVRGVKAERWPVFGGLCWLCFTNGPIGVFTTGGKALVGVGKPTHPHPCGPGTGPGGGPSTQPLPTCPGPQSVCCTHGLGCGAGVLGRPLSAWILWLPMAAPVSISPVTLPCLHGLQPLRRSVP